MRADGSVLVSTSWAGDHIQICNLKTDWKTITPDVCMGWIAKLDAAATMNKTATIFYWNAPQCANIPFYEASPAPGYIMVLNS